MSDGWHRTLVFKSALACTALWLGGCGAWQSVTHTSTTAAHAVFVSKVKQMNLVLTGRAELNRDDRGASLPVTVRVYQLINADAFSHASYTQLLTDADTVLTGDSVRQTEVVLGPTATVTVNQPMADETGYVGVLACFREPEAQTWRLVIPRQQWKQTDPVQLELLGNRIQLQPKT